MKRELEAVNKMLTVVGEPPLVNEDDYQLSDEALQATAELNRVKKKYLARGYKFNTRDSVSLAPDVSGFIHIPANAIDVIPEKTNLVIQEGLFFDLDKLSFIFSNSEDAKLILDYDFNYLPHVLAECILAEACYIFQRDKVGDNNITNQLEKDLQVANRDLNVWLINNAGASFVDTRFSRRQNPTSNL